MLFKICLCRYSERAKIYILSIGKPHLKAKYQSPKSEKHTGCARPRREHIRAVLRQGKLLFSFCLSAVSNRHDEDEAPSKPSQARLNPRSHTWVPRVFIQDYRSRKRRNWLEKKPQIKAAKSQFFCFYPLPILFIIYFYLFLFKFN